MTEEMSQQTQTRGDQAPHSSPRTVSMKGIKDFVSEHLPVRHPLREVVLHEKDRLTPEEAVAKLEVWLILLNHKN